MKSLAYFFAFSMLFAINKASAQKITQVEMQVTGLTCSMCSQATEKSLRSLPVVAQVTPDLNKNVFLVTFKKDAAVNFDQLAKKVKDAGFSVGSLQATIQFNDAKIDANGILTSGATTFIVVNGKNRNLDGPVKVTLLDKNFISSSAYKKKAEQLKLESYTSGLATINGKKTRVYHLSI